MKKLLVLMLSAVMVFSVIGLTGCGGGDDSGEEPADGIGTATKGVLVVGLDDTFAPMGFRDKDNNLIGFDIDLANEVGKKMGVEVKFQPIEWDSKELQLKSKKIDCVWNGMSVTPERLESMEMTHKYLLNNIILMATNKDIEVKDAKKLADIKIATQADSAALEMLKANDEYENFKDNIQEYPTYDECFLALKGGRADVMAIDQVLGLYMNENRKGEMKVCEYALGEDAYAIGCLKGNTALRDSLDKAIKECIDDGSAAKISEKWFNKDIVIFEPANE